MIKTVEKEQIDFGMKPESFNPDLVIKKNSSHCELCWKSFGGIMNLTNSRNHCYYCGVTVCNKCCDKK